MRKRMRFLFRLVLITVLCAGILTACGADEEEQKSAGKKRKTATESITPDVTPTSGPTDTPTVVPTSEPTDTPTPEPTAIPTAAVRPEPEEVECGNGAFSFLVPGEAEVEIYDDWVLAESDTGYMEVFYLLDGFSGMIYDLDSFEANLKGENTLIDALDVIYYKMHGEAERKNINGMQCLVGPHADVDFDDEGKLVTEYSRFMAFDCKDEFGIIMVFYTFPGKEYAEMTEQDFKEADYWMSCAESLVQNHSPLAVKLRRVSEKLADGSVAEFVYIDGDIKEIESDPDSFLTLKPYGTHNVTLYVQHVNESYGCKTPMEVYEKLKAKYEASFDISDPEDELGYVWWTEYGEVDGAAYEFLYYCAPSFNYGGQWLVSLRRPGGQDDVGEEDIFDLIIWSLRDSYYY
ncbi:MAG: hypothetical protein J5845_07020 [Lachnospiraceae bacterium]|nr:hypothetical protein [Lachnospiraceae bacterium]